MAAALEVWKVLEASPGFLAGPWAWPVARRGGSGCRRGQEFERFPLWVTIRAPGGRLNLQDAQGRDTPEAAYYLSGQP